MAEGSRTAARERALSLLYEADIRGEPIQQVVESQQGLADDYAAAITFGVGSRLAEIDELIRHFARGWAIDRMPATDRSLLRMAVWELLECRDVPTAVILSEAVVMAKRYSTDDSGRFVNGVLAAIADHSRQA